VAIGSLNALAGAAKQALSIAKTASRTAVATAWFSTIDLAGNPGAGVLAGTSTAAGVVPTDATAGMPVINAFAGGADGQLAQLEFGNTVACRMKLFDLLFKAGAYAFNANTALAAQPSYSSRVAGGTDFKDTQIWIEAVTAFTGNLSVAVTYTNQDGTAGRTTGTVATGTAPTVGRLIQLPLQAGDTGIKKIESVVATVATVGTFNVLVLRPLWSGRVKAANDGEVHSWDRTGQPQIWADSALMLAIAPDSTATGIPEIELVIASG
jgi:hypothetical protein